MEGIRVFVDNSWRRPKSKKEIKEIANNNPQDVQIEFTSLFADTPGEYLSDLPKGKRIDFVGPDPYTRRNFYGTITVSEDADGSKRFVVK